jgi:hypothetical protein
MLPIDEARKPKYWDPEAPADAQPQQGMGAG